MIREAEQVFSAMKQLSRATEQYISVPELVILCSEQVFRAAKQMISAAEQLFRAKDKAFRAPQLQFSAAEHADSPVLPLDSAASGARGHGFHLREREQRKVTGDGVLQRAGGGCEIDRALRSQLAEQAED